MYWGLERKRLQKRSFTNVSVAVWKGMGNQVLLSETQRSQEQTCVETLKAVRRAGEGMDALVPGRTLT